MVSNAKAKHWQHFVDFDSKYILEDELFYEVIFNLF